MKKVIFIIAVFMTSLVANSQSTAQNPPKNAKIEYSYLWGLFKSENYPKDKIAVFEFENPKISTSLSKTQLDSIKYEQKSILWGAIKWTEKKKNFSPIKSQSNGK